MSDWVFVIDTENVPTGRAVPALVNDRWFAVCNDNGTFHVTAFNCPHENGPLGKGYVHNGALVCPVHHWPWDLKTGLTDPKLPHMRLKIYPCEVRDGRIYADITHPIPLHDRDVSRPS